MGESHEQIHKIMTTLSSKHVQNLEKACIDLAYLTRTLRRLEYVFDTNS